MEDLQISVSDLFFQLFDWAVSVSFKSTKPIPFSVVLGFVRSLQVYWSFHYNLSYEISYCLTDVDVILHKKFELHTKCSFSKNKFEIFSDIY